MRLFLGLIFWSNVCLGAIELSCESPLDSALCIQGQKFFSELEETYGALSTFSLRLNLNLAPDGGCLKAGVSREGQISLNPRVMSDSRLSLLKHELAHVYLSRRSPERGSFFHEVFALWSSQDDVRVSLENNQFYRRKEALEYLKKNDTAEFAVAGNSDRALARVLTHLRANAKDQAQLDVALKDLLKSPSLSRNEQDETKKILGIFQIEVKRPAMDFAYWDGSGRLIESEGRLTERFPTGSVMKPLLVATEPDFQKEIPSRDDPMWFCPQSSALRKIWDWQEALVQSCNGFFLDQKKAWEKLSHYRKQMLDLDIETAGLLPADVIGVVPHQKMSLTEVARAYRWLSLESSLVVDVLKRVPMNGTLSGQIDSDWFVKNQVALKSGSLKDEKAEPLDSWIVAVDARNASDPQFLAVVHAEGKATTAVLPFLKKKLQALMWKSRNKAHVQILAQIPDSKIEGKCAEGPLFELKTGHWRRSSDGIFTAERGEAFRCLTGPLRISFFGKTQEPTTRDSYGVLLHQEESEKTNPSEDLITFAPGKKKSLSSRQVRARAGSRWVLETSERDYLFEVVASEQSRGRSEALKALALVARANLEVGWKKPFEICDTTICQVFGHSTRMSASEQAKLWQLLHSIQDQKISNPQMHWLPFSAGGNEPWTEARDQELITGLLGAGSFPTSIEPLFNQSNAERSYRWTSGTSKNTWTCEDLRAQLALPACPLKIEVKEGQVLFRGMGLGHGRGLDVIKANDWAAQGLRHEEILLRSNSAWMVTQE